MRFWIFFAICVSVHNIQKCYKQISIKFFSSEGWAWTKDQSNRPPAMFGSPSFIFPTSCNFSGIAIVYYPAPGRRTGYCFRTLSFFLSFFVSLSATLRENGWTDLHEIFREGVEWPWDDLIKFWVSSGKRVGGSKVNLLSPAIGLIVVFCQSCAAT